ncbi:integrase zinc binding domain-containing protein, partial [Morganella morganii]|uniref:integrase zinc binding domain-containing protein n=1 Tax=Morganella morganii TaxID=582 RepID=UPI0032DB7DAA
MMEEVHEGICSAHQGPRTLAQKIILMGYYWPSINMDCEQYVRRCATCQEFHKLPGRPATYYQPVSEVIPFARWGVDLIGAFPMAAGRKKNVIVGIDYFTKW